MIMNRHIMASIMLLLILLTGCNNQNTERNEFSVWANNENMNDDLRESLFKCLDEEEIEYQVDDKKNVLIKNNDIEKAVNRCS